MHLKPNRALVRTWLAVSLIAASLYWTLSATLNASNVQAKTVTTDSVSIVDFAYAPAAITVSIGSTIEWVNTGVFTHTTTSDVDVWNSGDLGPGGTFSFTFTSPGVYLYHCAIHLGMTGKVTALASVYLPSILR